MQLKDWKQKTIFMKILTIVGIIISITIVILAFMQIFNVWHRAIYLMEPLLGVLMLIQTIENWKTNKVSAYCSLGAAIFVFAVAVFIIFF